MRSFLGLANYYKKFIKNFSKIAAPLSDLLTTENKVLGWNALSDTTFQEIKLALVSSGVLRYPNFDEPFEIHTNASGFVIGGVLMQGGQLVAFESKKLIGSQLRWPTHEKELFAIVHCFMTWRHYLRSVDTKVFTDNISIKYLDTKAQASQKELRWYGVIVGSNVVLIHKLGRDNVVPDALSRKEEYLDLNMMVVVLSQEDTPFEKEVKETYKTDGEAKELKKMLNFKLVPKKVLSSKFPKLKVVKKVNGLIYYKKSRLYLPEGKLKREMMREYYDSPLAGHRNDKVTTSELSKKYYWPNMKDDVHNYVASCSKCQMNKHSTMKQVGLLKPSPIPQGPYRGVTMDFITSLPKAQGCDAIFVVVDRFTKQANFAPTTMNMGAEHTAKLFFDYWISQKGYPEHIVSDRDVQFQTAFWQYLMKRANTRLTLTTSFHPQGDGQTERINVILNMYLRNFIAADHGD
jgi:antitoxin component YwqK of YwqJK toxin-antitoxin module